MNQNQEILVEDPIPLGLLDEGNRASREDWEHLVHPAKVLQEVAAAQEDVQAGQVGPLLVEDQRGDGFLP